MYIQIGMLRFMWKLRVNDTKSLFTQASNRIQQGPNRLKGLKSEKLSLILGRKNEMKDLKIFRSPHGDLSTSNSVTFIFCFPTHFHKKSAQKPSGIFETKKFSSERVEGASQAGCRLF